MGALRAVGRGRHPGRDRSPPEYLRQCRPPVSCGAGRNPLARAGIRQRAALGRSAPGRLPGRVLPPWRGLARGRRARLVFGDAAGRGRAHAGDHRALPGAGCGICRLAREDGWSPAVGLIAFVLHIALPGGWYHGGYTELVQWGLVTNVAGAVAALCMLPAIVRVSANGAGWSGAVAAALAAAGDLLQSPIAAGTGRDWAGSVARRDRSGNGVARHRWEGNEHSSRRDIVVTAVGRRGVARRRIDRAPSSAGIGVISSRLHRLRWWRRCWPRPSS